MALHPTRRRFTVAEYHRMAQAGILSEDDRLELIDGEILKMTPIGRRHAACVKRLNDHFSRVFADAALIGVQDPVYLSEDTEPQPEVSLLRRRADYYAAGHPTADDVLLLVEVADAAAELDRRLKVPLYARYGISEVWLVDLQQETVTVYQDPAPDGYRTARVLRHGERLAPAALPDRALAVGDILG